MNYLSKISEIEHINEVEKGDKQVRAMEVEW